MLPHRSVIAMLAHIRVIRGNIISMLPPRSVMVMLIRRRVICMLLHISITVMLPYDCITLY